MIGGAIVKYKHYIRQKLEKLINIITFQPKEN